MPTEKQKSIFLEELQQETKVDNNNNEPKKKRSAIALFVAIFMLFLLIIALFIFIMSVGGSGNPILKTFGVPEDDAKRFLLSLVNWSFGIFALVLLMIFTIAFFVGLTTKKENKLKRRGSFVLSVTSGALIFLVILVWLGMYNFVDAFVVETTTSNTEIEMTASDGQDLDNLKAPVDIEFSATDIRKAIENKGYTVEGFRWDFGTGTFQALRTEDSVIQHFDTSGEFVVRLEVVTQEKNDFEPFKLTFKIKDAEFTATPSEGDAPLRVEFNTESVIKNLDPESYNWDFDGDGEVDETTTVPTASYTYEKIGTYYVKLRVLSQNGNVKIFNKEITVTGESADKINAVIDFVNSNEGEAPFKVILDASDSSSVDGQIIQYEWKFNDGSRVVSGANVTHTFEQAGTYEIELTVTDELGSKNTSTETVTVKTPLAAPLAVIETIPDTEKGVLEGDLPLAVKFDASKSTDKDKNIIEYNWDFDSDGKVDATGSTVEYTFREEGAFTVTLQLVDADKNTGEAKMKVVTKKQNIQAVILADPETGTVPLTVDLDGSSSWCNDENCNISSFEWDFGDGSERELTGAQVSHYYPEVGAYEVKLKIYTNTGKTAETTKNIYVRQIPLTACFVPSRKTGEAPLTVSFDPSCTIGAAEDWEWDFGDGVKQKTRKPTHTFQIAGKYTVQLRVFDDKNNVSIETAEITVSIASE